MPAASDAVTVTVRVTWADDGDPAGSDATVTATPLGPDGPLGAPVPMAAADDGRFSATVSVGPGPRRVRIDSTRPTGSSELDLSSTPTTVAAAPDTTTEPTVTAAVPETTRGPAAEIGPTSETTPLEADESDVPWWAVALVVVGAVGAIVGTTVVRRGRSDQPA